MYLSFDKSKYNQALQNLLVESCTTGRNVGTPEGGNQGNPSSKWNLDAGRSKMSLHETFSFLTKMGKSSKKNRTLSPSPRSDVAHLPQTEKKLQVHDQHVRYHAFGFADGAQPIYIELCRWHIIYGQRCILTTYIIIILRLHVIDSPAAPSLYLRLLW